LHYKFEWDPTKEKANVRKHRVSFRRAATVFQDPYQLSIYDAGHSEYEDRWITIGVDGGGALRVVVHTFKQVDEGLCEIRIISARKTTSREARQYSECTGREANDLITRG
jgi:uncharacterized DUF497 family protein